MKNHDDLDIRSIEGWIYAGPVDVLRPNST